MSVSADLLKAQAGDELFSWDFSKNQPSVSSSAGLRPDVDAIVVITTKKRLAELVADRSSNIGVLENSSSAYSEQVVQVALNIEGDKAGESSSIFIQSANDKKKVVIAAYSLGFSGSVANHTESEYVNDLRFKQLYKAGVFGVHTSKLSSKTIKKIDVVVAMRFPNDWQYYAIVEGLMHGLFKDNRFKARKAESELHPASSISVHVIPESAEDISKIDAAIYKAETAADGVVLTKQLVNAPPNVATPSQFAQVAVELAAEFDCLTAKILEAQDCAALKMGSFLGVAQGSAMAPKFIHLTYTDPSVSAEAIANDQLIKLAFVGKGIIFDSGGINLKTGPDSMIHVMKFDCGGAAAVLGAAKIIAKRKPKNVEVHFIIAVCENAIGHNSYRPGDVLVAMNGKSIEIANTDAEGRMTLADALCYAEQLKPHYVVDIATLTGACMIALGTGVAGVIGNHVGLTRSLLDIGACSGEYLWELPLEHDYCDELKSEIADIKHLGNGRAGGAIHAALFLEHFVPVGAKWAHLDIASTAWNWSVGEATGYGAKLLSTLVDRVADHLL